MNKHFASNFLSQRSIERDYLLKNVKTQFLGCLIKILSLSTEQLKNNNI